MTVSQAILRASLDQASLSVDKFSRWLRTICSILLSRNTVPDRSRAVHYIEQAITVLDKHGDVSEEGAQVCRPTLQYSQYRPQLISLRITA